MSGVLSAVCERVSERGCVCLEVGCWQMMMVVPKWRGFIPLGRLEVGFHPSEQSSLTREG